MAATDDGARRSVQRRAAPRLGRRRGRLLGGPRRLLRPGRRRLPPSAARRGRHRPTASGCSTSAAAPGQTTRDAGPGRVSRLGARRRPVVDGCSTTPGAARRSRGRSTNASLRAGRRPDPPVRRRRVRRGHQPDRGDVLRRSRRRVHQHRPGPATRRPARAADLAAARRTTSGSASSRARWPPAGTARRRRLMRPARSRSADPDRVRGDPRRRRVHRHRARRRRAPGCGSGADVDDAARGSCSVCSAGCSKASTTPAARRALDALRATIDRPRHDREGVVYGSAAWIIRADAPDDRCIGRRRARPASAPSTPSPARRRSSTALDEQAALPAVQRLRAAAVELLAPRLGDRLVDAGCGTGDVARALAGLVGAERHGRGHRAQRRRCWPRPAGARATGRFPSSSGRATSPTWSSTTPAFDGTLLRTRPPTRRRARSGRWPSSSASPDRADGSSSSTPTGACTPSTAPILDSRRGWWSAGRTAPPTGWSGRRLPALLAGRRPARSSRGRRDHHQHRRPTPGPAAVHDDGRGRRPAPERSATTRPKMAGPTRRRRQARPVLLGVHDVRRGGSTRLAVDRRSHDVWPRSWRCRIARSICTAPSGRSCRRVNQERQEVRPPHPVRAVGSHRGAPPAVEYELEEYRMTGPRSWRSSAGPGERAGRSSATPATGRIPSAPTASRTLSVTPSCWPVPSSRPPARASTRSSRELPGDPRCALGAAVRHRRHHRHAGMERRGDPRAAATAQRRHGRGGRRARGARHRHRGVTSIRSRLGADRLRPAA